METIILGLGSNRGDSKAILAEAIKRFASFLSDIRTSSVYITKPQDYLDQDDFYNMVVSGNYAGSSASLLKTLQHIEADYGRNREAEIPKGPAHSTSIFSFSEVKLLRSIILRLSSRIRRYTGEPSHSSRCWSCIPTTVTPLRTSRSPPHSLPYPIKAYEKVSEQ